jgi:RNA polymerase subunit RPABC4/transcription elongation factor Spt4
MSDAALATTGVAPIEAVPDSKKQRACDICAELIDVAAKYCTKCESYQSGKPCRLCGKYMPPRAVRCPACETFQDMRRWIPGNTVVLALLVSLISVIGTVAPAVVKLVNYHSKTTGLVLGTEIDPKVDGSKSILWVRAFNSGGRPSLIRDAELNLAPVRASVDIEILNMKDAQAPASGKTDLRLFADKVNLNPGQTKKCLLELLAKTDVTLTLIVDESDRLGRAIPSQRIPLTVRANSTLGKGLREWTAQRIKGESGGGCQ